MLNAQAWPVARSSREILVASYSLGRLRKSINNPSSKSC